MIEVRIEQKNAFKVVGRKTWITGQDNEQFGNFWAESHQNGFIDLLREYRNNVPGAITKSFTFGVSCVEKNPDIRAFDFYIAAEENEKSINASLEHYTVPACTWAIFSNRGELPMSLVNAEMYAFMEWLPSSGYKHAFTPELEVYPACDDKLVEYWLPIIKK